MMFVVVAVAVLTIACGGSLVAVVVLWRKVADLTVYTSQLEEGIARAFGQHDDGRGEQRPRLRVVRGGGRYLAGVAWVGWLRDHPALASSAAGAVAATAVTGQLMLAPEPAPPASMPDRVPGSSTTVAPPTGRLPAPRVSTPPAPTADDRSNRREPRPASERDEGEPSPEPTPVRVEVETTNPPSPAPGPAEDAVPDVRVPRLSPDADEDGDCPDAQLACVEVRVELDTAA